jgi:hypothetical protein
LPAGKKALFFFYAPMIAWGLAKAILDLGVLLKTRGIKSKQFCHRVWEDSRLSPFFRQ